MRKQLFRSGVFVALLVLTASIALAEAPPWGYVEAGYLSVDPDDVSGSGDNVFAGASMKLFKNFHVGARYVDGDYSDDLSQTYWTFAFGWHGLLGEKADLLAEATWNDVEIDNIGDDGVGVTGGIRWRPIKFFEADGLVQWIDFGDSGSTEIYQARGIFYVWRLGFGATASFLEDATQYDAFIRFTFGKD